MYLYSVFSLKRLFLLFGILSCLFFILAKQTHAASLSSASATLTTSRPSASSPINANVAAGAVALTIFNNGSRYLASDSAKIIRSQGTLITSNSLNVSTQSADLLTVNITNSSGITLAAGVGADVLFVPITAMHTFSFTINTQIPSGGDIIITYPGSGNNTASPSASGFAFNNLNATTDIQQNNVTGGCTFSIISNNAIKCVTGGIVTAGTTIKILVGCTAISGINCTTQKPLLINPTKSATAGSADIWKVGIATHDGSSVVLDNSTLAIGTVESVTVRATIDPSLTFTITGVNNNVALNGIVTGCAQADTTNSGINSSATDVSLGSLGVIGGANVTVNNIAAQSLSVTTNGINGYSITATSSGQLSNLSTGFFLNSSLTPLTFPSTGHFFGVHACGVDSDKAKWQTTSNTACNTVRGTGSTDPVCKYGWPTATTPLLISQNNSGTIGSGSSCAAAGCGLTVVSYAATQDVSLPPGNYQAVISYVATASF